MRKFVRKFAAWAVLASLLYLTWWALDGAGFGSLWDREGEGGFSVLDGVDLVVAITVSWIPLVGRLHALRTQPQQRLLGDRRRVLPRGHVALAARRRPLLLA